MINLNKLLIISSLLAPNSITIHRSIDELPNINQTPRMITMSIYEDAKTQMAFNWNTTWETNTTIQLTINDDLNFDNNDILEFDGTVEKSLVANDGYVHQVVAKNLKENTKYYYRVGDKESNSWSDIGSFTTANSTNKTKFIHISDPQGYEEIHYKNYNELLKVATETVDPDFFCLTGDIVNNSYEDAIPQLEQWEWALTDQKEFMQNYPFMTTAGNHEAASYDYNSRFNHPISSDQNNGSYYSFNYQGSHFISLNTNDSNSTSKNARGLSEDQINWLINDLKEAKGNFIIVMMHKGIYDAGGHCSNQEGADFDIELIRKQLSPIFTEYNVDLVLQGHDHLYSRSYPLNGSIENEELITSVNEDLVKNTVTKNNTNYEIYDNPDGTIYLNSGTASGSKYYSVIDYKKDKIPLEKTDSPSHRMFTEIIIEDNTLYANVYKLINGEAVLFDTFGIQKSNTNNHQIAKKRNINIPLIIGVSVGSVLLIGGVIFIILKKKNGKEEEVNG